MRSDGIDSSFSEPWASSPRGRSRCATFSPSAAPRGLKISGFLIAAFVVGLAAPVQAQPLDETWTLSVGGQTVRANPDGTFRLANIASADQFGPLGPGSAPDFVSDTPVRVVGSSTAGGATRWVFSEFFQFDQGETFIVTNLTFTDVAPLFPVSLTVTPASSLLEPAQTTQLTTIATLGDGSMVDVTPTLAWTIYRTSNPDLATVDQEGLLTAHAPGIVFVTATNDSVTAVTRLRISAKTVVTTVDGFVQFEDGSPAVDASVVTVPLALPGQTDAAGHFTIAALTLPDSTMTVLATAMVGGTLFLGSSEMVPVVPDGFTDVGIIVVHEVPPEPLTYPPFQGQQFLVGNNPSDVAQGDLDGDGDLDLVLANENAQDISVLLNNGDGTFATHVRYTTGSSPVTVTIADFNNDGDLDVAALNQDSYNFSILINQGDGTLLPAVNYASGTKAEDLIAADIDNDNDVDVVVVRLEAVFLYVFRNNGDGTFAAPETYFQPGRGYASGVAAGDVNEDGFIDLAVARELHGLVGIMLNNGDGTFEFPVNYSVGIRPGSVALRDLDGDGALDLAVTNQGPEFSESPDTISVLFNLGDGTFSDALNYVVGDWPSELAAGDIDGDGFVDLVVANRRAFSGASTVSVLTNDGNGLFPTITEYPAGSRPSAVVLGDFNGNGRLDAALPGVAPLGGPGQATILLNDGRSFKGTTTYAAGDGPTAIAAADFDGDGDEDLAVANKNGDDVSVFLNNGDGTLAAPVAYPTNADQPSGVAAADLNGDGNADLAVTNLNSSCVSVLLSNGDGTFGNAVNYLVKQHPTSIAFDDVDGDGFVDLVVAVSTGRGFSMLFNNGDGTFEAPICVGDQYAPNGVAVADLDGDGDLDLAVPDVASASISVRLNNGDGTFSPRVDYPTGNGSAYDVIAIDLDGDMDLDLASSNLNTDQVATWLNAGDGTFGTASLNDVGDKPIRLKGGDLDGDGDMDLVVANDSYPAIGNVSVLLNQGGGVFAAADTFGLLGATDEPVLGDFDLDGDLDIAANNDGGGEFGFGDGLSWFFNNGDGSFGPQIDYEITANSTHTDLDKGDVDNDGDLDIAMSDPLNNLVRIFSNDGTGTFTPTASYHFPGSPNSLTLVDLAGDGYLDLAVAQRNDDTMSIRMNNGDGTFGDRVTYPLGRSPVRLRPGDLDGDGDVDLAVVNNGAGPGNLAIMLNKGDGTFPIRVDYATSGQPTSIAVGDLDGDLVPDVVTAQKTNLMAFMLNNGDGTFGTVAVSGTGTRPESVTLLDSSGLGLLDIAVAAFWGDSIAIHFNNGDGSFAPRVEFLVGSFPIWVTSGDINGDLAPDLATANVGSDNISVVFNNNDGTFSAPFNFMAGEDPDSIVMVDLDGDGDLDLVVANLASNTLTVHINRRIP